MKHEIRVAVLRGGPSAEREVSLLSGAAVAAACRRLGYHVIEFDISPTNLVGLRCTIDVVFPVLHGRFGEDGELQSILEDREMCFVGSNSTASRLAMDKDAAKRKWQDFGLPTPTWTTVDPMAAHSAVVDERPAPPVVVKPVAEGSSIGVCLCETIADVRDALPHIIRQYGRVMIEKKLIGPELTVGILGERALPIIQVKPAAQFYDYDAKYKRNDTAYLDAPEVSSETYRFVQKIAVEAFHVLGCRDYGRVDLMVDQELGPQLLEINTIPGFTDHSLLPKAASLAGIQFDDLVDILIKMAFLRVSSRRPHDGLRGSDDGDIRDP